MFPVASIGTTPRGHPHSEPSSSPSPPAPSTDRAGVNRCWTTTARSLPLAGSRPWSLPESLHAALRLSTIVESTAERADHGPAVRPASSADHGLGGYL